jgi:hypothetical protein
MKLFFLMCSVSLLFLGANSAFAAKKLTCLGVSDGGTPDIPSKEGGPIYKYGKVQIAGTVTNGFTCTVERTTSTAVSNWTCPTGYRHDSTTKKCTAKAVCAAAGYTKYKENATATDMCENKKGEQKTSTCPGNLNATREEKDRDVCSLTDSKYPTPECTSGTKLRDKVWCDKKTEKIDATKDITLP